MEQVTEKNNSMMESLDKMSKSPSFLNFLAMPLIGSVFARRRKSKDQPQTQSPEPNTLSQRVPKNKDPAFTTLPAGSLLQLKVNDSSADVLGKIYNFMRFEHKTYLKSMIADKKFQKKMEETKEKRNKELIDLFTVKGVKPVEMKPTEKPKEPEKPKVTPKPESGKGATPTTPSGAPTVTKPTTPTPTTSRAPTLPSVSTAAKVGIGVAGLTGLSAVAAKISKGESLGQSKESYTQANIVGKDVKGSQIVKGNIDVTTNKPFEKSLNEMTIGEVVDLAKRRYEHYKVPDPKNPGKFIYRGGSAMGKYQFIPGTLKDQAQKLYGEGWQNHLFDNQAQEDLNLSFLGDNAKRLKAAGLPVTDASLYMMHFFGNPRQTGMVLNGKDDTRMSEILGDFASKQNPGIATMTVADYKNHLRKKGFDFQSVDVVTPTVAPKTTGDALDNGSKTLRDAKNDSKRSGDVTILNKNTTIRKGSNIYESPDENTYASPILHEQYGY